MTQTMGRADPDACLAPASQAVEIAARLLEFEDHPLATPEQELALGGDGHPFSGAV